MERKRKKSMLIETVNKAPDMMRITFLPYFTMKQIFKLTKLSRQFKKLIDPKAYSNNINLYHLMFISLI